MVSANERARAKVPWRVSVAEARELDSRPDGRAARSRRPREASIEEARGVRWGRGAVGVCDLESDEGRGRMAAPWLQVAADGLRRVATLLGPLRPRKVVEGTVGVSACSV